MTTVQTDQQPSLNGMQRFIKRNPNYFKEYYKKNKKKFYQNGQKRKTTWYGIEIFGTTYYFDRKQDIQIKTFEKNDLNKSNFVYVKQRNAN